MTLMRRVAKIDRIEDIDSVPRIHYATVSIHFSTPENINTLPITLQQRGYFAGVLFILILIPENNN